MNWGSFKNGSWLNMATNKLWVVSTRGLSAGCLGFRLLSAPSVWALVATSFQMVVVVKVFILKLTSSENWTSFNLAIANLQDLFILCTAFHAFITWSHTPAITRAFNRWLNFHVNQHLQHSFNIVHICLYTVIG